ncbi:MAG: flagellar type III secretion system pore protein FliP [Planctomycetota bacterium]
MKRHMAMLILMLLAGGVLSAQELPIGEPPIPFPTGLTDAKDPKQVATVLEVVALITILTLAPSLLVLTTAFTRIVIVLSFLRRALTTQSLPPNQVMMGLSLFLTFVVMHPTWSRSWDEGISPYLDGTQTSRTVAYERAAAPVREFMFAQVDANGWDELYLFIDATGLKPVSEEEGLTYDDIPTPMLASAFVLGELKRAFIMGFFLYLPFLIIDMVVSSILMSMGMMMLPPIVISLPFKILIFVMADGWRLVVGNLMRSFGPVPS